MSEPIQEPRSEFSFAVALGSALWCSVNRVARTISKVKPKRKFPVRTLSVGNLEAGGVGKTPVVAKIARDAIQRGETVAVLLRGYHSPWERSGGVLAPGEILDGHFGSPSCGDEAALLHDLLPEAWIGVGADRWVAWEMILSRVGSGRSPTLVILDDGLQRWDLARDLDIVLVTSDRPRTRLFREFPSSIPPDALVLWTKGDEAPAVPRDLQSMVRVEFVPKVWVGNQSSEKSRPLLVVSGIGKPEFLWAGLRKQGWTIGETVALEDHAELSAERVQNWRLRAREMGYFLAITGKDWVKWKRVDPLADETVDLPLVFEPEVRFLAHQELWSRRIWGET